MQRSAAPGAPKAASSHDDSSVLLVQKCPEHSSIMKEGNRGQRYSVYLLYWYISTSTDAAKRRTGTSWRHPRIRCQYLCFCTWFTSPKAQILTPEAWGIAIAGTSAPERDPPPPARGPPHPSTETDGSASRTNRAAPGTLFACWDEVLLIEMKSTYADVCWRMLRCWRMLTCADVCWHRRLSSRVSTQRLLRWSCCMLTYAGVCWRMLTRSNVGGDLNLIHLCYD